MNERSQDKVKLKTTKLLSSIVKEGTLRVKGQGFKSR